MTHGIHETNLIHLKIKICHTYKTLTMLWCETAKLSLSTILWQTI